MKNLLQAFTVLLFLCVVFPAAAMESPSVNYRLGNLKVYGDGPSYLDLGIGYFNIRGNGECDPSAAARIEFRWGKKLGIIGPAFGLMGNVDEGYLGYGGLYADLAYGPLVLTPLFAAGAYEKGDNKDLGGTLEFRSALKLSYQFEGLSRLGLEIAHVSNADLHDENPGEEEVYLFFALPF